MKKVLVATVGFGSGHNRAAAAMAQKLQAENPGAEVRVVDFLRWDRSALDRLTYRFYFSAIKWTPFAYHSGYRLVARLTPLHSLISRPYIEKMSRYLDSFRAELIVSTHVFCAMASHTAKSRPFVKQVWGVLTDFMDDRYWNTLRLDRFFVPSDELKDKLVARGVPAHTIEVAPIPVKAEFLERKHRAEACAIVDKRLKPDIFTVLALGGGNGLGGLYEVGQALSPLQVQVIAVAGVNEDLKKRLDELRARNPNLFVFGYVENIHDFMDASDLCVTKPGGVTIAECMAKGLPIAIYGDALPGPESENVDYLVRKRAAEFYSAPGRLREGVFRRLRARAASSNG